MGLWRNSADTPEGKYPILLRRDGTAVEHPYFAILARDPCAPEALAAYAATAERLGFPADYVADIRQLAVEYNNYRILAGDGDPGAPRHRKDDPATLAWARSLRTKVMTTQPDPALIEQAREIDRSIVEDLDRRRVNVLARCILMLETMCGSGPEIEGHNPFDLHTDAIMALGIEDADDIPIAAEIARDHPEGNALAERFAALFSSQQREREIRDSAFEEAAKVLDGEIHKARHPGVLSALSRSNSAIRNLKGTDHA